jgi:hypothetical protein
MTIGCFMVIASLVGCGGAPKAAHSGFLDDYSQLKPSEQWAGASFWESPRFKDYHTFMVDPTDGSRHAKADGGRSEA